ncbi:MAG: thioredoxin family protein [Alphaproteobacteria bacterium]
MNRRVALGFLLGFIIAFHGATGLSGAKAASGWVEYSPIVFSQAQRDGKTILVDVHAVWCPTCKAQNPILDELTGEPKLKDIVFIKVDFDREKDFLRTHNIRSQSTIVVFKGTGEVARSVGQTDREKLRAFVFGSAAN